MINPLLHTSSLPAFSVVRPEYIEPAIDQVLADNRAGIKALLAQAGPFTWQNLMYPLEALGDRLGQAWSIVSHLNNVVNSVRLREAYNACLPKLSDYITEVSHNVALFKAIQSIQTDGLDLAQKKVIENELRDFRLAGVALSASKKKTFATLQKKLSSLDAKFEENVLDATQGWTKRVTQEKALVGLPDHAIKAAKACAEQRGVKGWLFTLELPSYIAVMTYADSRTLRKALYIAYVTRASDQGPNAGQWDNTGVMRDILKCRHGLAAVLDFSCFAAYSLATKMAESEKAVLDFLADLVQHSHRYAQEDYLALEAFAKEHFGVKTLVPWDIAYFSEKLRQARYDISQEDLRPYFPESQVLLGMFEVVKQLYGMRVKAIDGVDTWHKDVCFFEVYDEAGVLRGQFYTDLYARMNKRGGAWADGCRSRRRLSDGTLQTPVAYLNCNFNPPVGDEPALLTHDDVVTLFHEFGHCLQHVLTTIDYADVSGMNGVPWDAVELPSQLMENWCWEKRVLDRMGKHYKTGKPLPDALFKKMQAAKNFQSGMLMARQLEFSLFDFRLHVEFDPKKRNQIQRILNEVRKRVAVVPTPDFNRFQNSFTHVFGGGYAAGYYSYKWAEVLSADVFSLFEQKGVFDSETGRRFLHTLLEKGGSEEPMALFVAFRGRAPSINALLRHLGIK